MPRRRLIPLLLVHRGGLWLTRRFRPVTYLGDPTNAVRIFNDHGVDELMVIDIDASRERHPPDLGTISRLAAEAFVPLTVGGGISRAEDADALFDLGVEKVVVGAAAVSQPWLITEIAERAGAQAVVGVITTFFSHDGPPPPDRRAPTSWTRHIESLEAAGAGEIMIQSLDRDGCLSGPDLTTIGDAASRTSCPVIAAGGFRDPSDVAAAFEVGASAVAASAMLVVIGQHKAVLIHVPDPAGQAFGRT